MNPYDQQPQLIREHIIALAKAVEVLNNYGSRLGKVHELVASILRPTPEQAEALEAAAVIRAAKDKNGPLRHLVADWDDNWHFIFQFRHEKGYSTHSGFDLRPDTPGLAALKTTLEELLPPGAPVDLSPPEPAGSMPARRLIYPAPKPEGEHQNK